MKSFYFLFICSILIGVSTNAQEYNFNDALSDSTVNYYPLSIGNKWIYRDVSQFGGNSQTIYYADEVVDFSVMPNGKSYYKIIKGWYAVDGEYERIDSTDGSLFRYEVNPNLPDNEYLVTNLSANVGDTTSGNFFGYRPWEYAVVISDGFFTEWGLNTHKKQYRIISSNPYQWLTYTLAYDLGLIKIDYSEIFIGTGDTYLEGCIIDSIVYGDTTLVSVYNEKQSPQTYSLSQNYPNPFNPSTKINYQIPELSFVTLKIYDVLGSEIVILVNEEKPTGNYEVEFDAITLPSGIYFYQLQAGEFVDTKKMMLLK